MSVVSNQVSNLRRLWQQNNVNSDHCTVYSSLLTWLVLKTNFVPRVRLSVTIIKFFREGLCIGKHNDTLSLTLPLSLPSPVVDNILVVICDEWFLVPPLQDMDAIFIDGQPEVLG